MKGSRSTEIYTTAKQYMAVDGIGLDDAIAAVARKYRISVKDATVYYQQGQRAPAHEDGPPRR